MGQDDLHQQFVSLKENFSHLGTHLANASDYLQADGTLPSQQLIEELVTARADFDRFGSRVLAETQSLDLQPIPELDDISSLSDLESLLHHIEHAEKAKGEAEVIRQCALALLARVRTVDHAECDRFAPLLDIQGKVGELRDEISNSRWTDLPPDTQVAANGRHPFPTPLTPVERQAELDDDAWVRLQGIVTQSFGRPMSVAAARGKLFLNESAAAERHSAPGDTKHEKTAPEEEVAPSLSPPLIDHEQTVTAGDEATPIIPPGDIAQESPVISQDDQVTPSAAEEVAKTLRGIDGGESQVVQDKATVEMPTHGELFEASTATATEIPHVHEDDAQYNTPSMKQAVLDRLLKEQLDAVRKEVAGRQKQNFIKNIGRRIRS
jgi:hypothetical protein